VRQSRALWRTTMDTVYRLVLYYACSVAGLVTIVGGIWLLAKQKIYLNAETGDVVSVDIPLLGKFKTNIPSLGLFVLGSILLLLPVKLIQSVPTITPTVVVRGSVRSNDHPVVIYAVIGSGVLQQDGSFAIAVPLDLGPNYEPKVLYTTRNTRYIFDDPIELTRRKNGSLELLSKKLEVPETSSLFPPTGSQAQPSSEFQH
jgi:hypothetical protein